TREELGLDPEDLGGNPWRAAGTSFGLFALGAIFPAVPFFWSRGLVGIGISADFGDGDQSFRRT
ncbi:VIT1/CCC1 transporter family protein, partial [Burkholderia vietnamiensis]|uniref:VIT1/CCC1 transporter family protein n=1 Tax=Burkholderia vietnamiensis TaxID=60552 RepID=UPI001FC88798